MRSIKNIFRIIELLLLFFVLPVVLVIPIEVKIKLIIAGCAILFVGYCLYKNRTRRFPRLKNAPSPNYLVRVLLISAVLFFGGILFLSFYNEAILFKTFNEKWSLWIKIIFVYTFLSVLPQEMIYRRFFYMRYSYLVPNKKLFFLLNACCFSLCHLFLQNGWVLLITFFGGCLFAYTYEKEKSIRWVIIEHALYGNIIFTIGLGEMLAFPT